jgi:hypothetical protein
MIDVVNRCGMRMPGENIFSLNAVIITSALPPAGMPVTRHHIYLFVISLGIVTCLVLLAALAEQSVSAEGAVQAAINDPGVRDRIGSNYFVAGEVVSDSPFSQKSYGTAPVEVWVVPVIVHNGTADEVYHVDVTKDGKVYGISGPLHIEYSPADTAG